MSSKDWQNISLAEVSEKIGMGPFGSNIKVETFVSSGVPVISGQHLRNCVLEDTTFNYVTEEHAQKLISANVYRGDVVFTHAGNIKNVSYIPENSHHNRYVLSQRQFFVRPKKEKLNPAYLTYFFHSTQGQYLLLANSTQVGVPSIAQPITYFKNLKFLLPAIDEQDKIVKILGDLDHKIKLNRKMNETLEQIGQTLFKKYFYDNPEREEWRDGTILDLGNVVTGKTPSKSDATYYGNDVMFLKVPDMHGNMIVIKTADNLSTKGADSQSNKYLTKWSTCVSCIATVGVVSLAGNILQTNQQINSIIPKDESYTFYNYYLLRNKSDLLQMMASAGSTTPNLNKSQFEKIKVKLPPSESLSEFQDKLQCIFEIIHKNYRETEALSKIRDYLLPKLISGQIAV
ncbi:MAG: hypothetical protein RL538_286 [Candidatus Parcubacteria bacterium]|jgi:type I restriction enzyme S subunit